MAIIGRFIKDGAGYLGNIGALIVKADRVRIVPEARQATPASPSHRVYAGDAEIGVAWPRRDAAGNEYLNLKLDDFGLPGPFYPTLVRGDDAQTYVLVWSRSNSTRAAD